MKILDENIPAEGVSGGDRTNSPVMVQWAVTGRCNYRCRHCFVDEMTEELPLSRMEALCDRLAEAGVEEVCLTGGEPLLRPDLPGLLRALSGRGIRVTQIATNGSLLTEETLRTFEAAGHRPEICVSYDGCDGCHNWLRRSLGAEEDAFRAMALCRQHGWTLTALMTLYEGNLSCLRASLRALYLHGCSTVKVKPLLPLGRAACPGAEARAPGIPALYEAFLDAIAGYSAGEYPLRLRLGGFFATDPEWSGWTAPMIRFSRTADWPCQRPCGHAVRFPFLTSEGRLLPCAGLAAFGPLARSAPSLLEMSVAEAMKAPLFRDFHLYTAAEQARRNPDCAACPALPSCGGGCRMNALAFGEGFSGCDRYCCAFFQDSWREKIPDAIRRGMLEKALTALPDPPETDSYRNPAAP